ncbi:hypothetical protein Y032_0118g759 [Ancylostoma ceylanicum]|uniref:Uncharacterized protein n=1 Tax=Ancylostoma ceylanicum TaxID=53326 RepID=A0A016TBQ8_9BILA|nr:hypothetical protein Y032_0118g759 [Ancylostoma ceylanicum]
MPLFIHSGPSERKGNTSLKILIRNIIAEDDCMQGFRRASFLLSSVRFEPTCPVFVKDSECAALSFRPSVLLI